MLALKESTSTNLIKLPERGYQTCPLCSEKHPVMMRGLVKDMEDDSINVAHDKGYSFCNCFNIFFTDWKNIRQDKYDETYHAAFQTNNLVMQFGKELERMFSIFKENSPCKSLIEIGCIHDCLLDMVKEKGLEVFGLDLSVRKSKYDLIFQDIELFNPTRTYDIVWASHLIEHLKDPKSFLIKCSQMIGKEGVLYIATPDTFFIDFEHKNPLAWDWMIEEHYILWGMESLIEFAEGLGLKCVYHERNLDLYEKIDESVFWKNDMKLVFKNA